MEKINYIKAGFYAIVCMVGGIIGNLFGGLDTQFYALLTCSIIDYLSMDVFFEISLAISSFVSILLLYKPLEKVIDRFV